MRVVAGSAGGIPLRAPAGDARPTMDRVKGAIFSSLGERTPGARVLDLFAGGGGLGIEALSRGCAAAVFVDNDARAVEAIRTNLEKASLRGEIRRMGAFEFLDRVAAPESFDLIFADPPYAGGHEANLLASASLRRCLAREGLFVLERAAAKAVPQTPWRPVRIKKYGATEVLFLELEPRL